MPSISSSRSARGSEWKRRLGTADGAEAAGRGDGAMTLAPAVEELHEQARAVRLHGARDAAVAVHDPVDVAGERVAGEASRRVHGRRLDDDHADAAAGPGRVVGDEVVGRQVVRDERRLVGGRDDPVGQPHGAEVERGVQRRGRHECRIRSTPRRSRPRAMISRWISDVPSQIRSTRSSRRNRSATFVRI